MQLVVEQRLARHPAWWLLDEGRVVAWGGGVFPSLGDAEDAARDVRQRADDLDFRTQRLVDEHWRWTAWRGREKRVIVGMGSYLTREQAEVAARTAHLGLPTAVGP